tara:strand:- start:1068 stop:1421 length:354 start_codon:yes stop_codon:yes gene_type:complete
MKYFSLFLIVSSLSLVSLAQVDQPKKLLSCNPPNGSTLQEVLITQVGNKIFRSELTFRGYYTKPVEVNPASWAKQDLRWKSETAGQVHMHKVNYGKNSYWEFKASGYGFLADGYCEE